MVIPSINLIILMISCAEGPDDVFQSLFAGSDVRMGSMTLFVFVCYLADALIIHHIRHRNKRSDPKGVEEFYESTDAKEKDRTSQNSDVYNNNVDFDKKNT